MTTKGQKKGRKLTPAVREEFLERFGETCNVKLTCDAMGLKARTVYHLTERDPKFKQQMEDARALGVRNLEDEAHRRAFQGFDEPVFFRGEICGAVRKYSDTLLIFLLKAHCPERFRERYDLQARHQITNRDVEEMSDAELLAIVAKAKKDGDKDG